MTVKEMAEKLNLKLLAGEAGTSHEIKGCYIGDLLSWAMSRCVEGDVWITVMGNLNAIAVSTLADAACIILVDSAELDEDARQRAEQQEVAVYSTDQTAFQTAVRVKELLPE